MFNKLVLAAIVTFSLQMFVSLPSQLAHQQASLLNWQQAAKP
jgi:hypothetical protein